MSRRKMTSQDLTRQGDELYERYGKLYEAEHWGEFIVISPDGRTVVGPDELVVDKHAIDNFGPGCFIFKVGEKSMGKIR
jgi:hypothetical protein